MIMTEHGNRKKAEIMSMNPIACIRDSEGFKKATSGLTVFFFLFTFYSPSALAIKQAAEKKSQTAYKIEGHTDEEKLSNTLQTIKERVNERKTRLAQRVQQESNLWQDFLNLFGGSDLAAEDLDELLELYGQAHELHQSALRNFDEIERDLKAKKLPAEILHRHYDAVAKYKTEYQRFQDQLQRCREAKSLLDQKTAIEELDVFLQQQQFKRSQKPFDPNQLPFGTPDPKKTRQPVTEPRDLNKLLGFNETQFIEKVIDGVIAPAYAQTGNQPASADLQPTIDVQITPAIQQKAAELNHDPIQIYNWVRNTIEFLPTYGSIQGSQATLENGKGNAFDTASLLIALLRASNIPARYAYGTVRMPVEQVMNWVGGVEVPMAALSILGQGGIPATGITQGGRFTHVKLEHIWVEAWVDFEPSRGVKNIEGDSWIPLDASFKQYDYTDGIDIAQQVPFDAESFAQTIINSATIDETTGTVQNIDQQFIQTQLTQYQQQVENFINTQSPDVTVGEVVGTRTIRQINVPMLAAGQPYNVLATGNRFDSIPDNLRHKYQFQLQGPNGSFTRTLSLPELAGKTLALSFRPATPADEETLQSFIPDNITDISQLPQSLPGYLINLEAELVIDNQETLTGARMSMGSEVTLNQALYSPRSGWEATNTFIVAGEYHAIGVSGSEISEIQLDRLRNQSGTVRNILKDCRDNQNCEPLKTLNVHQLTGSVLQGGVLGWFGVTQNHDKLSAKQRGIIYFPLPSYGKFGTSVQVQYSWGIPRNVSSSGALMDIDLNKILAEASDASPQDRINFVKLSGHQGSVYEHVIPEELFSTQENRVEAISAVKAIAIAAQQGEKIYTLTQSNRSVLENITIDQSTKNEIRDALDAGKEIVVSGDSITLNNWQGLGYIIIDPATGSGAYKISGGFNGGSTTEVVSDAFLTLLGLLKDFIIHDLGDKFLGVINTIIDAITGVIKIWSACSGLLFFAFLIQYLLLFAVIVLVTLLITAAGGGLYAFILGVMLAQILGQLVQTQTAYCRG